MRIVERARVVRRIKITQAFCERDPINGGAGEYWPEGREYEIGLEVSTEEAHFLVTTGKAVYVEAN